VTIHEVLSAVAEFYCLAPEDLRGKQRDKHIDVPRQVAMYLKPPACSTQGHWFP